MWVFGGALSDDDWQGILARRAELNTRSVWKSVVDENPEIAKECAGERDQKEVQRAIGQKRSLVQADKPSEVRPAGTGAASASSAASSGSAGPSFSGEPATKKRRPPAPFNVKHYSQAEASTFLPAAKGCSISPVGNRQWQVKYMAREKRPKSHSVTYHEAPTECKLHSKALAECVMWAWTVHVECGGEACPFDLSAVLADS